MTDAAPWGAARSHAIQRLTGQAWPGTADLIEQLLHESQFEGAWRPSRAVALMAAANPGPTHVWMTVDEFRAALAPRKLVGSKGPELEAEVGISPRRRKLILDGKSPISKAEAMAIAHFVCGLPLPIPAGDTAVFVAWVEREFGLTRAVTKALAVDKGCITNRLRGYTVRAEGRSPRLPEAGLIRAMDWCLRVGPFSPYGDRLGPEPFPKGDRDDA